MNETDRKTEDKDFALSFEHLSDKVPLDQEETTELLTELGIDANAERERTLKAIDRVAEVQRSDSPFVVTTKCTYCSREVSGSLHRSDGARSIEVTASGMIVFERLETRWTLVDSVCRDHFFVIAQAVTTICTWLGRAATYSVPRLTKLVLQGELQLADVRRCSRCDEVRGRLRGMLLLAIEREALYDEFAESFVFEAFSDGIIRPEDLLRRN